MYNIQFCYPYKLEFIKLFFDKSFSLNVLRDHKLLFHANKAERSGAMARNGCAGSAQIPICRADCLLIAHIISYLPRKVKDGD